MNWPRKQQQQQQQQEEEKCLKIYFSCTVKPGTAGSYQVIRGWTERCTSFMQEMLGGFLKDPGANWEEHALLQLNALHQFVVTVLLGTNTLVNGEKTLQDFNWEPIAGASGDGDPP